MGGIIGLDYKAVYDHADRFHMELDRCTFKKIQALERFEITKDRKQNAKSRKQKTKDRRSEVESSDS